jgi:RNA methyltransferase, TrmH family
VRDGSTRNASARVPGGREQIPQCYASAVQRITSRQNAIVAEYREAARGAARDTLLLDGLHLVGEAIAAGIRLRHIMIATDALDRPDIAQILERIDPRTVKVATGPGAVMDAVSPVRSSSPIVALGDKPAPVRSVFEGAAPLVVVVCDVQDPGNVGAIIRVAEGAGASGVIVTGQSADPFGWRSLRGSMGSALRLPIAIVATLQEALTDATRHAVRIVATVPREGVSLFETPLTAATALLIGGEGVGLPDEAIEAADLRVTIPMEAPVESLNAAIAAAVLLYEAKRQRSVPAIAGLATPDRALRGTARR